MIRTMAVHPGMGITSLFNIPHAAKRLNRVAKRTQHVVTKNVATCYAEMLR